MEFNVVNHEICVGNIKVVGVSSAPFSLLEMCKLFSLLLLLTLRQVLLYCILQQDSTASTTASTTPLRPRGFLNVSKSI